MNPDVAMQSRTIDAALLGKRIKAARVAAGMTQSELAGDDASTAYISRIEDGQRRPSPRLLIVLAERMSTTVETLVRSDLDLPIEDNLRLALDHAELSLLSGNPADALDGAEAVLGDARTERHRGFRRAAEYVKAGALEALGDLNAAIVLLEDLTADPEKSARWLKALTALCRCYKEQGDFHRAIAASQSAQPYIEELGLVGTTESIQLTVSIAGAYINLGDLDEALRICQRAIDAAEEVNSPIGLGSAYWNASIAESRRGANDSALLLAHKALALFEIGDDFRNLGRLRTQIAILQLRVSPPDADGAMDNLHQATRELSWSAASPLDRAEHSLALARAHFVAGDGAAAEAEVDQALATIAGQSPSLLATAEALRGQIAISNGDPNLARSCFQSAVQALTGIGADRDASRLWSELASLLDELGEKDLALDAYRRAVAASGLAPQYSTTRVPTT
ncbi:tetratricopeptide repeat protein [Nocardioides sp.]|uniref:tetratricopeptide repeat protein n=1 Tax=Nocardioides sp. TaxID=35761 RepID=UPI0039E6AD2B